METITINNSVLTDNSSKGVVIKILKGRPIKEDSTKFRSHEGNGLDTGRHMLKSPFKNLEIKGCKKIENTSNEGCTAERMLRGLSLN